jgi:hypothetical protein
MGSDHNEHSAPEARPPERRPAAPWREVAAKEGDNAEPYFSTDAMELNHSASYLRSPPWKLSPKNNGDFPAANSEM